MDRIDFFTPHLYWLRGNPAPPSNRENLVRFRMTSNRDEADHFVLFAESFFNLQGNLLVAENVNVLFSNRGEVNNINQFQPFNATQPEVEGIRLPILDGPLERLNQSLSGNIIARYSTLDFRDNGLLVCTSDFTREIVVLSLQDELSPELFR